MSNDQLAQYVCDAVIPVLKTMPAPELGEWNWPEIVARLEELTSPQAESEQGGNVSDS